MKKTLFGILVAVLGIVLGAGGMFYYGLIKPAGPSTSSGAPAGAPSAANPAAQKSGNEAGKAPAGAAEPKSAGVGGAPAASSGASATAASPVAGTGASAKGGPGAGGGPGGPSPVEIAKPELISWPRSVTAVGTLRSDESMIVRSEVAGRIVSLNFQEGQRVGKGQVLVKLDESVPRAELEQARANQRLAKAKFDRAVELKEKNFISGQAKDEAENAVQLADANAKLVEARLQRLTITAPFAGAIGLRSVGIGDYVRDGQDIVTLDKTDPIKVDFKVPELFLSAAKQGQTLQIALDSVPNRAFTGIVTAINPQLDAAGRAVILRAQLPNRDGVLRAGMFARVRLLLSENADAITILEQSLAPQGDEQFVFRVVEGRAVRTKVEIGQRRDGRVEIVNGLTASDTVVAAGWQRIRDGAAVRPVSGGGGQGGAGGSGGKSGEKAGDRPAGKGESTLVGGAAEKPAMEKGGEKAGPKVQK